MGLTRTSPRVSAEVSNSEVASEEPFVHLTEDFFHQLAASLGPHQLHGACITERPAGLAQPQERLFAASEYGFNRGQYLRRAEETVRLSRLEAFLFPATVCQRAGRHDPIQFASRESPVDQHIDKLRHDTVPVERYKGKGMVYRHVQHVSPTPASAVAETCSMSPPAGLPAASFIGFRQVRQFFELSDDRQCRADSCRRNIPGLPNSLPQPVQCRACLDIRSALLKYFQEFSPIDRLYSAELQVVEFVHVGVHHARPRKPAKVAAAVRCRFVEDLVGFARIRSDFLRNFDAGILFRSPDVLPVIVSICRRISCRFHEWFKEDWRTTDDVTENSRNDDDQILLRTCASRRLKSRTRFRLLCQQVPALQLDTQ